MQNANQIRLRERAAGRYFHRRIADFKVLIALRQHIRMKAVGGVREKDLRPYFRIHCLAVYLSERDAEDERTQVVHVGHAAKIIEASFGGKVSVLAALVLAWSSSPPIDHPEVV